MWQMKSLFTTPKPTKNGSESDVPKDGLGWPSPKDPAPFLQQLRVAQILPTNRLPHE